MNITFSIKAHVVDRARRAAMVMGKSLNQVVLDYLEQFAGQQQTKDELQAFERSALATPGALIGCRINRDDINRRG